MAEEEDETARFDLSGWLHRMHKGGEAAAPQAGPAELDADQLRSLTTAFVAPRWLKDLGLTSWFLVGCVALLAGIAWLVAETSTIVMPVLVATILATVAAPIVALLQRHRVPRAAGAAIVLVGLGAIAVLIAFIVIAGISSQRAAISEKAAGAADKLRSWLTSAGVSDSGASGATSSLEKDVPATIGTLLRGIVNGIAGTASFVFALSLAALSTFFLLKDGPTMRGWVDRHLGVGQRVGETITGGVIRSLRGYFKGVTIIAAFNGVVVAAGALLLGVPLAGTIGVVTFVTAYVPYLGAFVAGAFAVVLALGGQGASAAVIMLVIVLLANGLMQNILQPFVMGSALDLNPLVVLVVTIGAGCLFGMMGLVLAAPLASAAVHITRDLAVARHAAGLDPAADGLHPPSAPAPTPEVAA